MKSNYLIIFYTNYFSGIFRNSGIFPTSEVILVEIYIHNRFSSNSKLILNGIKLTKFSIVCRSVTVCAHGIPRFKTNNLSTIEKKTLFSELLDGTHVSFWFDYHPY